MGDENEFQVDMSGYCIWKYVRIWIWIFKIRTRMCTRCTIKRRSKYGKTQK